MKHLTNFTPAIFIMLLCIFFSCSEPQKKMYPTTGMWYAELSVAEGEKALPFRFEIKGLESTQSSYSFGTGAKRLTFPTLKVEKDSLLIPSPVFDTEFRVKLTDANTMDGYFYKLGSTSAKLAYSLSRQPL